jgi:hypothetical protein
VLGQTFQIRQHSVPSHMMKMKMSERHFMEIIEAIIAKH